MIPSLWQIKDGVKFTCSCGGNVVAAMKPRPVVLHSLPMCKSYEKLEPDEFLRVERERLEKTR